MKYLLSMGLFVFLFACSNKNDITTQLLNEKKATEDSAKDAASYESFYLQKAKEEMRSSGDSLKYKPLIDSSTYYFGRSHALKEKLKALEFSIDSIAKMK